jgi:hypothetical protein
LNTHLLLIEEFVVTTEKQSKAKQCDEGEAADGALTAAPVNHY